MDAIFIPPYCLPHFTFSLLSRSNFSTWKTQRLFETPSLRALNKLIINVCKPERGLQQRQAMESKKKCFQFKWYSFLHERLAGQDKENRIYWKKNMYTLDTLSFPSSSFLHTWPMNPPSCMHILEKKIADSRVICASRWMASSANEAKHWQVIGVIRIELHLRLL